MNPKVNERESVKLRNYIKPANGQIILAPKERYFSNKQKIEQNNPEQTSVLHGDKGQEGCRESLTEVTGSVLSAFLSDVLTNQLQPGKYTYILLFYPPP